MAIPEEKQQYADVIRQLIPVNELPAEVQNDIITKADLIELKKKGQVFNQGDRDGYSFYLIDCEINLVAQNIPWHSYNRQSRSNRRKSRRNNSWKSA